MSYSVVEKRVKSSDGVHNLVGLVYIPDSAPRGIFQIVHGMTEHIKRYEPIMSLAAENGFVCFGFDNLGHGMTALNDGELGFIAKKDGYKYLIEDVGVFSDAVKAEYPGLPYFLLGHSMGSFIARLFAVKYGSRLDGLIISGTGGPIAAARAGIALTSVITLLKGDKYISKLAQHIAFGTYNKRFEGKTKYDWLSVDTENIRKYSEDKFCTFPFTISAMRDLMQLTCRANSRAWFKAFPKNLPLMLISGMMDPVGDFGNGPVKVMQRLVKYDISGVSLKLFPECRHEILNDICKNDVNNDIINFLKRRLKS